MTDSLLVTGRRLRVLTLNLWARNGPYDRRAALLRDQVRQLAPDLIALQEVASGPAGSNQAEQLFGAHGYRVLYEPREGEFVGDPGLAVLSRYPVLDHTLINLPHGGPCLAARVEAPSGPWWFCSTMPMGCWPHQEVQREDEVVALDRAIADLAEGDELPPIVAGDFDAAPDAASIRFLTGKQSLQGRSTSWTDAWTAAGNDSAGSTWSTANPYVSPFAASVLAEVAHSRRLSYVLVGSPFRWRPRVLVRACSVVLTEPRDAPPSDHYGVLADLEIDGEAVHGGRGLESWTDLSQRLWSGPASHG